MILDNKSHGFFYLLRSDARAAVQHERILSFSFWKKLTKYALLNRAYGGLIHYRIGHYAFNCRIPVWALFLKIVYLLSYQFIQCWTATDISWEAEIGPYCLLLHSGQIIGEAKIGSHFVGRANILIGQVDGKYPAIGDNVMMGAHSLIVGGVIIGDHVRVGAGTTVVKDVPAGKTVVSARCRVVGAE